MLFIFVKDGEEDRKHGAKALCAFLHQLILQQPGLDASTKDDFENKSDNSLMDFDVLRRKFFKAFENASGREFTCVLDALNNCEENLRGSSCCACPALQLSQLQSN